MNNRSTIDNNGITKNSSLEIIAQLRGGSAGRMDIRRYFSPKIVKRPNKDLNKSSTQASNAV